MNKFLNIIFINMIFFVFYAYGINKTNELIIFEENIGMPDDILGIYDLSSEDNNLNVRLLLYYLNGKYNFKIFGNKQGLISFTEGTFIPSQVPKTSDYFLLSLIKAKNSYFREGTENGVGVPALGSRFGTREQNYLLVYLKKENSKLMIWTNLLSNKILESSKYRIKEEIAKSYPRTFIEKPFLFTKHSISESNLVNYLEDETIEFKEKYDIFRKKVSILDKKKKNKEYLENLNLVIVINEFELDEYKIIETFDSKETKIIIQRLKGREERLSSDEEKVKLISNALKNSTEKDIILDSETNLMWQDNLDAKAYEDNLHNAKLYCSSLSLLGFKDWELPTQRQFQTILAKNKSALKQKFKMFINGTYWAPRTNSSTIGTAHTIKWKDGDIGRFQKRNHHHIRCVRKNKPKI